MVVGMQPDGFLQEACEQFQLMLGYRWLVLQVTENDLRLNDLAGRLFSAGSVNRDRVTLRRIGRELQTETRGVYEPIVRDDDFQNQPAPINEPTPRLLVIPLHHERDRLGILFGGQPLNQDPVDLRDANKCATLAAALTMFLKNMLLYGDMERVFMGALRALTTAIDAKDRYTHGHSERVALMARKLSLAAGFDTRTAERVYLSGLVHDLGKIGVPEAVLCKPGRLTDQEFDLIKLHPTIGARILSGIPQMTDLIPGVLHHHERWDGRGYPSGLSKREIPCFGRLLALADTFDAMSSSRSYREALKHEEVLEEIKRNIGTQFDPELAEIFLGLDFEPFFMLHRQQKMAENAAKSRLAG
jgi:HD-GYP domain-containing protein (c-di-GMP phosphodiesterase class II)